MGFRNTLSIVSNPDLLEADFAAASPANVFEAAGNWTEGMALVATRAGLSLTGIRCWWPGGHGALTARLKLWDGGASTLIASADVTVDNAGIYVASFTSSQPLAVGKDYRISRWTTSGQLDLGITNASLLTITNGRLGVLDFDYKNYSPGWTRVASCWAAGDAFPATVAAAGWLYLVDPVFQ